MSKAKYHFTREPMWIARKRGCRTGIGRTPALALKSIDDANKALLDSHYTDRQLARARKSLEEAYRENNVLNHELQRIKQYKDGYIYVDRKVWEQVSADQDEGFVMMAMAYFQTTDPHAALKAAGALVSVNDCKEAAAKVARYMETWRVRFEAIKPTGSEGAGLTLVSVAPEKAA